MQNEINKMDKMIFPHKLLIINNLGDIFMK